MANQDGPHGAEGVVGQEVGRSRSSYDHRLRKWTIKVVSTLSKHTHLASHCYSATRMTSLHMWSYKQHSHSQCRACMPRDDMNSSTAKHCYATPAAAR